LWSGWLKIGDAKKKTGKEIKKKNSKRAAGGHKSGAEIFLLQN
jgi:hypothetical protein